MTIWQGVYPGFSNRSDSNRGFVHPEWVDRSVKRLATVQRSETKLFNSVTTIDLCVLSTAVLCASITNRQPRVLDVGGNLGQSALILSSTLKNVDPSWAVMERLDFLRECGALCELPPEITFIDSFEKIPFATDVVHFGSSLQYFDDWRSALTEATCDNTNWIALSDLPASHEIQTFASRQKYYEDYLECWFFNLQEVLDQLASQGFQLQLQKPFISHANAHYFPELSLPDTARIEFSVDLLFKRI